jgi:Tfp pilus assembly protein PilX
MTMRNRLREEQGWALVTAMMLMAIMLGTILSVATYLDGQTKLGSDTRKRETAFNLGEASLNGQIFSLSQEWPGAGAQANVAQQYPACTQSSTGTHCPNAPALSKLIASPDTTGVVWQTQVRDNGGSSPNFYSDSLTVGQPAYDANNDKQLWVRATATARGKTRTMVTLVRVEEQAEDLPHAAIIANRVNDSNNGNKTVVDLTNSTGANGFVGVRCTPVQGESVACLAQPWASNQSTFPDSRVTTNIAPYNGHVQTAYGSGQIVGLAERARFKARAVADGTYYATCPGSLPTSSTIIWIDSGDCKYTGNGAVSTGLLVINNGTFDWSGTADFSGVIYAINAQGSTGNVVSVHGNGNVNGGVLIEGNGVFDVGSSKGNLVFNDNAYKNVKTYGTAGMVQNTWREIKG